MKQVALAINDYEGVFIDIDYANSGFVPADSGGSFFIMEEEEEGGKGVVAGCWLLAAGNFHKVCSGYACGKA